MIKTKWKWPTWTQSLVWVTTLGMILVAVLPVLPEGTPEVVRTTIAIVAVVIAKLTQSERTIVPTVSEAHAVLADAGKEASQP